VSRRTASARPTRAADALAEARRASASLVVLRDVLEDEAGRAWREALESLAAEGPDPGRVAAAYGALFSCLAREAELSPGPLVGDAWQHHLLSRLLDVETPFSLKAERAGFDAAGPALVAQVRADLAALERCHRATGALLAASARRAAAVPATSWEQFRPLGRAAESPRLALMRRFHGSRDWASLAGALARQAADHGAGPFARFRAFRWTRANGRGALEGVAAPDPVTLADLVGYELEREPVIENTRHFVAGGPGNHVLLYGDRGTGKSSTVKALLNEFGDRGLRVVEVAKEDLVDYREIVGVLRGRRGRFVLFVDDLSFEEHETQYKALKAALEGSIDARPDNVVLYATSNRRHVVAERFSDRRRGSADDDVHPEDAAQEKLSLADRFGVHAPFLVPDRERYLAIVAALAACYDLPLEGEALRTRALAWSQWHNGLSCRTARQFVDALRGEAAVGAEQRRRRGRPEKTRTS